MGIKANLHGGSLSLGIDEEDGVKYLVIVEEDSDEGHYLSAKEAMAVARYILENFQGEMN